MYPRLPWNLVVLGMSPALLGAAPIQDIPFRRIELSGDFTCEGASFADLDGDGNGDVVAGPYWYAGPDFDERREIYEPKTFDPLAYSDNFFAFPHDFDADGWIDVLFVGFPGKEAFWVRNPRGAERHWERHVVFDTVDNESPTFTDLTGDGRPELVFHTQGRLGWASPDPERPEEPWRFHPLSDDLGLQRYTHGLGVGDVDGDGRTDVLLKTGWWQQPESLDGDPRWKHHPFTFGDGHGGAQMLVYDVDGDEDADVVTSINAHGHGLSWFEQTRDTPGAIGFTEHSIMGAGPGDHSHGVCFGELHALALADVDGDGVQDIVTGKRWWSHGPQGDPDPNPAALLYWFGLDRSDGAVRFVPHLIDDRSGVGVQVVAGDVDGDGRADVVVGNKRGHFVLLQDAETAAPDGPQGGMRPKDGDGRSLNLGFETGDLTDWTFDGAAFEGQPIEGDTVSARNREASLHAGRFWIGGYELVHDGHEGTLTSRPFRVTHPWASFLVGGGGTSATEVELVLAGDEDLVVFDTPGANYESLQRAVVDLRAYAGREIFVRIVDRSTGPWGHTNFDDFLFHAEEPRFERPSGVPEITQLDDVLHAGLTPEEAAQAMDVPAGFEVELIAAEPDLHQPIALAIDAKGRLWVAEAYSYPVRKPDGEGRDTILVFEDTTGDGQFDRRTVFAEGLNLVSGLEVGFGGVWVGAAPYLYFIPDRDDDLVPDGPPEVLLDGWAYEDTHETLNAFLWGPDGWLYGCHGVFTHSNVAKPGTPDDEREPINAGVWRYHPTRHEFEVFAWGSSNPWGVDFDDRGQAFITACVIPHLFHVVQGGRYHRQAGSHFNPHVYDDIETIADHRHYVGANAHSGNLRSNGVGGGHAHCGALIYLGDAFPKEYRGSLLMNNIHGNRINRDVLKRFGSSFVGRHASDFLISNDRWFRGINMRAGPAGSVYLIDWYDEQACHLREVERFDRSNGRLYRVSYGAHAQRQVDFRALASAELVARHLSRNEWDVRMARLVLQERGPDPAVHRALVALVRDHPEVPRRLRALWTLHATDGLDDAFVLELLADAEEDVVAWSVQLALEGRSPSAAVSGELRRLARESGSPVVRLYLASALQRLPPPERWPVVEGLVVHAGDAVDANLPYLYWYGLEPLVAAEPARALALACATPIEQLERWIVRRAASEPELHAELVKALHEELDGGGSTERARLRRMLEETRAALAELRDLVPPAGWDALRARLSVDSDAAVRDACFQLSVAFGDEAVFPELRRMLVDDALSDTRRELALDALARGRDPAVVPLLLDMLGESSALRGRALRALAGFEDGRIPSALLGCFAALSADERRDALSTLASRPAYARELLGAVARGEVARAELSAFVLRNLQSLADSEVDALIQKHWGFYRETPEDKLARIEEWKAKLTPAVLEGADRQHGRRVALRTCLSCHTLFGEGREVGPDLTGSNRADLDYLLTNLVDPNAVIGKDYQAVIVLLHDGRLVTGVLGRETESAITVLTENEELVIGLSEIDTRKLDDVSTMPEGQLDTLTENEVCDLVAYLQGPSQVPLAADEADRLFNGTDLGGWHGSADCWSVEDGEIVGRTAGLARNEFLKSELELADFRLMLEVLLVDDATNSGIQFRSRELEGGDVAGYQADIGRGWWGKLYDEHGRGLLTDVDGDQHVVRGGWNRYEILAVGDHVRTWINGELCSDLVDPDGSARGIVALQIHSGGPTEVRFRNFELELDPAPRRAFERILLTDTYYSEGANFGDLDRDGHMDVVYGPLWFRGPELSTSAELYAPVAQDRERYADNFFSWIHDFDGDGWNDVFVVGFPGKPAYVYRNPHAEGHGEHWPKHEVFDWVSNESPHFTQLVGDERPELVCTRDGYFGYASVDWDRPLEKWTFHVISGQVAPRKFGHGLGVGDVDGDGRLDVLTKDGWYEQPASLAGDPAWKFHAVPFAARGGAEMYAYDVDGDGDNDVLTSLAAHEFGLAWFEQKRVDGEIQFDEHLILGDEPEDNRYGVVFSELHTVNLVDVDGDGLRDIVTGKTYYSHHKKSPMWDAGAVVYWFKLVRTGEGVDWIPSLAAADAGVGRQVIVGDVNADGLADIVVGGMKGASVLLHTRAE
ncbi:MAG: DUF1080 domain-containing protein [bacterium]|nr:DUF1080 domain-containing protein [bacterium]